MRHKRVKSRHKGPEVKKPPLSPGFPRSAQIKSSEARRVARNKVRSLGKAKSTSHRTIRSVMITVINAKTCVERRGSLLISLNCPSSPKMRALITPILQMRKLRLLDGEAVRSSLAIRAHIKTDLPPKANL